MQTIQQRFESKFVKTPGCWEWRAGKFSNGYGQFWAYGTQVGAHCMAYELYVGPIPDGMMVCHTCDQKACVNPNHLFIGTGTDNMQDMIRKGRQGQRGWWLRVRENKQGARNAAAKLTNGQVLKIREDRRTQQVIAADYGIKQAQVSRIKLRQSWSHV